jgi:type IV secretion system protein VirB5
MSTFPTFVTIRRAVLFLILCSVCLPVAHAQFAVIDVASVTQLISEVQTLEQQLATAKADLAQAQSAYQSTVGARGMERLLAGTVRNYLPTDWGSLQGVLGSTGGYAALSADFNGALTRNAVLTSPQVAGLSQAAVQQLQADRQTVALLEAISHQALAATSVRFASLQQLIDAIARAGDQKASLDLHARIGAETSMLQNEQTKLQTLYQGVQAEQWANELQTRERVVASHGQFATRFQPTP